jgi:hypothetical protein
LLNPASIVAFSLAVIISLGTSTAPMAEDEKEAWEGLVKGATSR